MNTEITYNDFSWELAAKCLQGTNSNTCISPPGVFLLLSAIAAASEGLTKWELDQMLSGKALCDAPDEEHFANILWLNDLIAQCPILSNDTSIQVPAVYHLFPEYRNKLEDAFRGKLSIEKASGRAVVLQNLIVFRDKWKTKFEETTEIFCKEPYIPTAESLSFGECLRKTIALQNNVQIKERRIPYIFQSELPGIRLQENEEFISVAIPFSSDCHMTLSMPKDHPLEDCLGDAGFLKRALDVSAGKSERLKLYLPSFKIKNKLDLIPALTAMGANEVFDEYGGQIAKMVNTCLYIESAGQETEVEVTAEGAYAKALTIFSMVKAIGGISPPYCPPRIIKFNHPFLFAIWQTTPASVPLFIGAFQKPTE